MSRQPGQFFRRYGTLLGLLVIMLIFSILAPHTFPTVRNLINISQQIALLAIIATGATVVMALREFDLSVGSVASFGGVLATGLVIQGWPIAAAIGVTLAVAFLFGLLNGFLITRFRVFSFIVTLATGTSLAGVTFWYTGGTTLFSGIPRSYLWLGQARVAGLPVLSGLMLVVLVLFWFLLTHVEWGRRIYAIGGNPVAARFAGISVARDMTLAFGAASTVAALTGIGLASRLGSAHPTAGEGFLLQAYAAVFLGMTAFKEGQPNVWGTLVGALIIGVLANGLTILNVPYFLQDIITGVLVVLAVVLQSLEKSTD